MTRDSSGAILLGVAGSRSVADDRFPDTGSAEVAAIYELGVTRGASAAAVQDATMPPLDFNYEPDGTVDRGQMAAFITGPWPTPRCGPRALPLSSTAPM